MPKFSYGVVPEYGVSEVKIKSLNSKASSVPNTIEYPNSDNFGGTLCNFI